MRKTQRNIFTAKKFDHYNTRWSRKDDKKFQEVMRHLLLEEYARSADALPYLEQLPFGFWDSVGQAIQRTRHACVSRNRVLGVSRPLLAEYNKLKAQEIEVDEPEPVEQPVNEVDATSGLGNGQLLQALRHEANERHITTMRAVCKLTKLIENLYVQVGAPLPPEYANGGNQQQFHLGDRHA